ncbi:sensor histidine kinase [Cellulosilyticum sp. I15G10I2]|uniref:sensor histidine kinase n=1 Tax=Cellulosilyticum sp. I15G10I2 TaxID=1892843 RepID=UPI00114D2DAA|nr:sensor histidine kinase [Cellulosilyticum sp. I15G10I2]
MDVFFKRDKTKRFVELISYTLYFFIISLLYLLVNIPIIMLLANIAAFFALSFNYKALLKSRIIAVSLMYMILMSIESIVGLLTGYFNFPIFLTNSYSSILGLVSVKFISYIVVLLMGHYKNIKKWVSIPNSYWLSIILIPLSALYIMLVLFQVNTVNIHQITICITLLLFINFIIFHLYDVLSTAFEERVEKILLKQQTQYYTKQFKLLKNSTENIKSIRHDLKNHLSVLESFIKKDQKDKALEHISQIISSSYAEKEYASSGNIDIDSILNFKLQEAKDKAIDIALELVIPIEINVTAFDMVVVLGNLLDNALYAADRLEKNKQITIKITYKKGILFIHIDNTFDGQVHYQGEQIVTLHTDSENHGIGLNNIRDVLQKYNGTIEIHHTENKFYVDVLMYV